MLVRSPIEFLLISLSLTLLAAAGCSGGGGPGNGTQKGKRQADTPASAPDPGERLREAVAKGHLEEVRQLLLDGAEIESRNKSGVTPLMVAAIRGHLDIIDALLEAGADIDAMDSSGRRPIDFTVDRRDPEKVGLHLLAAGADVSFEGSGRLLKKAAGSSKFKLLRAFLEAGAQPLAFSNHGLLVSLAQQGEDQLLKRILDPSREHAAAALCMALERHDAELLHALIDGGTDANGDCKQSTALVDAVLRNDLQAVKWLVEAGADVNKMARDGHAPLVMASTHDSPEILRFLIEHGADVHQKSRTQGGSVGEDALIRAAERDAGIETLRYLIDQLTGTDLEPKAYSRALRALAIQERTEAVDLLLAGRGELSGSWANLTRLQCSVTAARLLLKAGVDPRQLGPEGRLPLAEAALCNDLELLDLLLAEGVGIDDRDGDGRTALHTAVTVKGSGVDHLLDLGADIDARDKAGKTPLMLVAGTRTQALTPMLDKLLLAGADIEARDSSGHTALMYAAIEIAGDKIALLVDRGADESSVNGDGKTPPDLYAESLLSHGRRIEIEDAGLSFHFRIPQCFVNETRTAETLRIFGCHTRQFDQLSVARSATTSGAGIVRELARGSDDARYDIRLGTVVSLSPEPLIFELVGPRSNEREMAWALRGIASSVESK